MRDTRKRMEALAKRQQDYQRIIARPPMVPEGLIWQGIQDSHPEISSTDLILLLSLVIDFWWGGFAYFKDDRHNWVRLGRSYRRDCNAEHCRLLPAQYVIKVNDKIYLVVQKDFEVEGDVRIVGKNCWVEIGYGPKIELFEDYFDVDMRESEGYRQILFLPSPGEHWHPPIPPERISGEKIHQAIMSRKLSAEEERAYYQECDYYERSERATRAKVLLSEAWKLNFLFLSWCGVTISEELWERNIDEVLKIPGVRYWDTENPPPKKAPLSWECALEKYPAKGGFTHSAGGDETVARLQSIMLLGLANQIRKGQPPCLTKDPLNHKAKDFQEALNHFRLMPGFRLWENQLRSMDGPRKRHNLSARDFRPW